MKSLQHLLLPLFITFISFAQTPEKVSYQAVLRDGEGILVTNKEVSVNLSVLQGNESGIEVYRETHFTETNANGLVSLEIGSGQADGSVYSSIDWEDGPYFIKTETTVDGSTLTSISELLSVPYALHAKDASKVNGLTVATEVPENAVFTDNQSAKEVTIDKIPNLDVDDVQQALEQLQETLEETGDMRQTAYDRNNDGIVDNASKVNGLTVGTNVPVEALFTDSQKGNEVDLAVALDIDGDSANETTVEAAIIKLNEFLKTLQDQHHSRRLLSTEEPWEKNRLCMAAHYDEKYDQVSFVSGTEGILESGEEQSGYCHYVYGKESHVSQSYKILEIDFLKETEDTAQAVSTNFIAEASGTKSMDFTQPLLCRHLATEKWGYEQSWGENKVCVFGVSFAKDDGTSVLDHAASLDYQLFQTSSLTESVSEEEYASSDYKCGQVTPRIAPKPGAVFFGGHYDPENGTCQIIGQSNTEELLSENFFVYSDAPVKNYIYEELGQFIFSHEDRDRILETSENKEELSHYLLENALYRNTIHVDIDNKYSKYQSITYDYQCEKETCSIEKASTSHGQASMGQRLLSKLDHKSSFIPLLPNRLPLNPELENHIESLQTYFEQIFNEDNQLDPTGGSFDIVGNFNNLMKCMEEQHKTGWQCFTGDKKRNTQYIAGYLHHLKENNKIDTNTKLYVAKKLLADQPEFHLSDQDRFKKKEVLASSLTTTFTQTDVSDPANFGGEPLEADPELVGLTLAVEIQKAIDAYKESQKNKEREERIKAYIRDLENISQGNPIVLTESIQSNTGSDEFTTTNEFREYIYSLLSSDQNSPNSLAHFFAADDLGFEDTELNMDQIATNVMAEVAKSFPDLFKEEFQQQIIDCYHNSSKKPYWFEKCMNNGLDADEIELVNLSQGSDGSQDQENGENPNNEGQGNNDQQGDGNDQNNQNNNNQGNDNNQGNNGGNDNNDPLNLQQLCQNADIDYDLFRSYLTDLYLVQRSLPDNSDSYITTMGYLYCMENRDGFLPITLAEHQALLRALAGLDQDRREEFARAIVDDEAVDADDIDEAQNFMNLHTEFSPNLVIQVFSGGRNPGDANLLHLNQEQFGIGSRQPPFESIGPNDTLVIIGDDGHESFQLAPVLNGGDGRLFPHPLDEDEVPGRIFPHPVANCAFKAVVTLGFLTIFVGFPVSMLYALNGDRDPTRKSVDDRLKGVILYSNGDVYKGEWLGRGIRNGFGTMTYKNGITYQGSWENNRFPRCDDSDGRTSQTIGQLSGEILVNDPQPLTCGDDDIHLIDYHHEDDTKGNYDSGTLIQNNPLRITLSNGLVYVDGYKKDSILFLTPSTFLRPDGSVLERLSDGEVRITYANKDVYEGQVTVDDKRHGQGKMTYFNEVVYEGEFFNDQLPCDQNDYNGHGGTVTVDGHTYSSICTKDELYLFDSEKRSYGPDSVSYGPGTVVFHPEKGQDGKTTTTIILSNAARYIGQVHYEEDYWMYSLPSGKGRLETPYTKLNTGEVDWLCGKNISAAANNEIVTVYSNGRIVSMPNE